MYIENTVLKELPVCLFLSTAFTHISCFIAVSKYVNYDSKWQTLLAPLVAFITCIGLLL